MIRANHKRVTCDLWKTLRNIHGLFDAQLCKASTLSSLLWRRANVQNFQFSKIINCVVPEIIHTSPTEGIFPKTPSPTPLEFPIKLHTFPYNFWPLRSPPPLRPPGISHPFCEGRIDIFWNQIIAVCYFWFIINSRECFTCPSTQSSLFRNQ